jgi:hypothetical protein
MTPADDGFDDDPVTAGRVIVTARVNHTGRVRSHGRHRPPLRFTPNAVQFGWRRTLPLHPFTVTSHQEMVSQVIA